MIFEENSSQRERFIYRMHFNEILFILSILSKILLLPGRLTTEFYEEPFSSAFGVRNADILRFYP
jgi:hypothetical protein